MKLFISYRRKTVHFAQRLVEKLRLYIQDEIFIDLDSVDDDDFEKSILGHLHQSDVILLLVTEFTFAPDRIHKDTDWVRKEIREALTNDTPIVLICENGLLPPYDLPDDIKMISGKQGINFYPEFFIPAVERLVEFLMKMGVATPKSKQAIADALSAQDETNPFEEQKMAFVDEALPLIESDELEKVEKGIFILEELTKTGYQSKTVNRVLEEAHKHREALLIENKARDEYEEIRATANFKRTQQVALDEFKNWMARYADLVEKLDYENLRSKLPKTQPISTENPEALQLLAELNDAHLPHLRRLEIGERLAEIGDPRRGVGLLPNGIPDISWCHVKVNSLRNMMNIFSEQKIWGFYVAKYIVTNIQYQIFVDAPDGYKNPDWWKLFPKEYRLQELRVSNNYLPNAPRDSISWYQSMAFANWIDAKYREYGLFEKILGISPSKYRIILPTHSYWDWMIQNGFQKRKYPWGNSYVIHGKRINPVNENSKTIAVGMYPDGNSVCGASDVYGMLNQWYLSDYYGRISYSANNKIPLTFNSEKSYYTQSYPYDNYRQYGFRLFILSIKHFQ